MSSLSSAPFIRILPAFCIGIITSFYSLINYNAAFIILLIGISCLIFYFLKRKPDYADRCYMGISFQFLYFILGFALTEIKNERLSDKHFSLFPESKYFFAIIDDTPKGTNGNLRTTVSLISVVQNGNLLPVKGKSFIYFNNDSSALHLFPGDKIFFTGTVFPLLSPLNPGQFDFKYHSSIHHIYHQARLNESDWKVIPSQKRFNLKSISVSLRNKFLSVYKNAGLKGQEYAVLSALVLGYDEDIDKETMSAFSASGTLHVLSVSGMHVGIIFAALSALLTFLGHKRYTRIIRLFILLITLWFYALLTGLSPSVIRSAMMFSFILVGRSLNRSSNIYNSLSLSALCIFILFDPLMLLEVGLQLSFLSVAGIAFLYPKIYKLIFIKNKLLDKTWTLVSVSIAAQTATFALSIYYFHQFPNYFIPANLLIIPLSTIGIFAGIVLLFVYPIPFLSIKIGWIVKQVISLLNTSAIFIENLPGSVWQGITINLFSFIIVYVILFAFVYYLEKKSINGLYLFLISVCVLFSNIIYDGYLQMQKQNFIIFSNSSSFCCQLNNGFESLLLYHTVDSTKAFRHSGNYCIFNGLSINNRKSINLDSIQDQLIFKNVFIIKNYILLENYLIQDLSEESKWNYSLENMKLDLIYINRYKLKYIPKEKIQTKELILNGKLKFDSLESRLMDSGIKIHQLSYGAKVVEL